MLWLVALATRGIRWRSCALYLPLLGYVAASVAAAAFAPDPGLSLRELGDLLTLVAVPMTVTMLDRGRWERLLALLAGVASLSALVAVWQYLHGASDLHHRPNGLANHYMTFAGWTLLVALLLVGDLAWRRAGRRALWTVPALLLCTVGLALSLTRGAWLGLLVGLVLAAALRRPTLLLVYPLVAVLLLVLLPRPLVDRAASIVDVKAPSNAERLRMLDAGVRMVRAHPVLGVGPGMVKPSYADYARGAGRTRVPHLHNNLVQVAAERGLAGAAAYLAILAVFFVHAFRALRRAGPDLEPALAGSLLAVAGLTVAGLFDYTWGDAEVWLPTLVCLGLPFALAPGGGR